MVLTPNGRTPYIARMVKVIKPDNKRHWLELRQQCITSTDVAALFNCSPYMTVFELWHSKRGEVREIEEHERMIWGNRLESAIAKGIGEDLSIEPYPMKDFMINEELKIGSSFDYFYGDTGILEIKNVDKFVASNEWKKTDGGDYEAPAHIEFQIQTQLLVSGRSEGRIGALVGGNEIIVLNREPDLDVHRAIIKKVKWFWDLKEAPAPDFERDAEFIISQYKYAEPNTVMTADERVESLAFQYRQGSDLEKQGKSMKEAAKAEMLTIIGDCEKVKGNMFSISAGIVGPSEYMVKRDSYRNFKLTWRKEK